MTDAVPSIEVSDKAKERLRAILAREAKARYIRIDVGRG
jgi:Fe-S cluster assembly iron-binding protein IscA